MVEMVVRQHDVSDQKIGQLFDFSLQDSRPVVVRRVGDEHAVAPDYHQPVIEAPEDGIDMVGELRHLRCVLRRRQRRQD